MTETRPKPFVFVLMPYSEKFLDIYKFGIKETCQNAGAYCERVDEQIFTENILERVYNQIAKADIIVSEMTERNANVFYETGYAHALSKRVILLVQKAEDIPFDLKQYPHIIYDGKLSVLKPELEKKIRWCIENPIRSIPTVDLDLEFFVNGHPLEEKPKINVQTYWELDENDEETTERAGFDLDIGIHNRGKKRTDPSSFDVALVTPSTLSFDTKVATPIRSSVKGKIAIHNISKIPPLLPDGWDNVKLRFLMHASLLTSFAKKEQKMAIRLFTEIEPKSYPFTVSMDFM